MRAKFKVACELVQYFHLVPRTVYTRGQHIFERPNPCDQSLSMGHSAETNKKKMSSSQEATTTMNELETALIYNNKIKLILK